MASKQIIKVHLVEPFPDYFLEFRFSFSVSFFYDRNLRYNRKTCKITPKAEHGPFRKFWRRFKDRKKPNIVETFVREKVER